MAAADPQIEGEKEKDVWLHDGDGEDDTDEHFTIGMSSGRWSV